MKKQSAAPIRRLLSLLLCLTLAFGLLPALGGSADAAVSNIDGYFRYTVSDQSVTIIAYTGRDSEVTVPSMIGGYPVNTIAAGAFARNSAVKTIYLPDCITTIEAGAFAAGQTVVYSADTTPGQSELDPDPMPKPSPDGGGGSGDGGYEDGDDPAPTGPEISDGVPLKNAAKVQVSHQHLTVDGVEKQIDHYNIDDYNYFKLRDLACLLAGTDCNFDVVYDEPARRMDLFTGRDYAKLPGDLVIGKDLSATAAASTQSITIDGKRVSLVAYNIGGYNYFKLRDLAPYLGFDVDYDIPSDTAKILTHG